MGAGWHAASILKAMPKPGAKYWLWALAAIMTGALLAFTARFYYPTLPADPATKLFFSLDAANIQLSSIIADWKKGNSAIAARELLKNIQSRMAKFPASFVVALPAWNDGTHAEADAALTHTFTMQGITGTAPSLPGGGFDWSWRGPNHDPEFAWFLNRQHHIPALFVAWRETKDMRYRTALNAQLRDWLQQSPRPAHYSFSSSWRALEVARRVEEAWMPVLFAPEANAALDDDVLLGLLADIPDHAAALRYTHSFSGNHLITEMTGLAALALAFPQFKDASSWLDYAVTQSRAEAAREIYPDGAETELSNLYQRVVMLELQRLADLLAAAGRDQELADLHPLLENGWNYFAYTLDPRGHGPLNNDSSVEDDATLIRQMATVYHRDDWLFLATNGREGKAPVLQPTNYFPYAGLAVMRGGWNADSEWAFFSMGPRGSDHQHADQLHLSIGGLGREFLVDDGRYNYQPGPWRDYFTGPQGHNVLLLDGQGPIPPPDTTQTPVYVRHEITSTQDFFEATVAFAGTAWGGQGPAYHTRAVLYPHNNYWIVVDRLQCAGGAHQVDGLWHFHPDCVVKHEGDLVYTANVGQPNLGLLAVGAKSQKSHVDLIHGRETPTPQGWYSPTFNERVPATCADFSDSISSPQTFVWVIWIAPPGQEIPATQPKTIITEDTPTRLRLRLAWPGGISDEATVPFISSESAIWVRN